MPVVESAFRDAPGRCCVIYDCPECKYQSMRTIRRHAERAARTHQRHCEADR